MKLALTIAICAALVAPVGLAGPVAPGTTMVQTDSNGVALNGVRHNNIALNRIATNRIATNRIAINRIAINRIAINKLAANKLAANKLATNKLAANKLAANAAVFGDATPLVTVRGVTLADGRAVAVDPGL